MIGSVISVGEVYGADSLWASVAILVAVALSSPIQGFLFVYGILLNSCVAVWVLGGDPQGLQEVYGGFWGYNGALAAACLGGTFSYFSPSSLLSATVGVVASVFVQYALR